MKKIIYFFNLFLFFFFITSCVYSQTSIIVGPTSGSTISTSYGPIFRNTGNIVGANDYSRHAYIYTPSDFSIPIPSGSKITKLEWLKVDTAQISGANEFNIWLSNISATSFTSPTSWSTLKSGATQVFASTSFSVPFGANQYVSAPFNIAPNEFIYSGGNLQILVDWSKLGFATGAINYYVQSAVGKSIGFVSTNPLSNSTNLQSSSFGGSRPTLRITYIPSTPCTGVPLTGGIVSTSSGVCAGVPFTLGIANILLGSGVTYKWQRADNAAFTVNVADIGTGSNQTTSQTSNKYYRCIAKCATGPNSDTTSAYLMSMNPFYKCMCNSSAQLSTDAEILNYTFGSLNNSSTCLTTAPGSGSIPQQYSNYQDLASPAVEKGSTVYYSIQIGTCGGSANNRSAIFIDYNQNGLFTDLGERVYFSPSATNGPHTESGTIVIPSTALTGLTAMRVITSQQNGVISDPCLSYSRGETEDYVVHITPSTTCTGSPLPGNTVSNLSSVCPGKNTILSLQNTVTGSGITYQWYNSVGPIGGATNFFLTTPNLFSPETFYCAVTCSNSGITTNSGLLTIGISPYLECYCSSIAFNTDNSDIQNVTINGVTNTLNCTTTAPGQGSVLKKYSNFHPLGNLTDLELEGVIPFLIEVDNCDPAPYNSFATSIWIDFNHNGIFSDIGEQVFIENTALSGPRSVVGNFVIPCTALTGVTGMRITVAESFSGSSIVPCLLYSSGETEDYLVNIIPSTLNPNTNTTIIACDQYTWLINNQTYSISGIYTETSLTSASCLKYDTLNLTIHSNTTNGDSIITSCDQYTWNGITYTLGGIYTYTSLNGNGCINIATLNLTLIPCTSVVNLKLFLQGYYENNSLMRSVLVNQGISTDITEVDSIELIVYSSSPPYNPVISKKGMLYTNGNVNFSLPLTVGYYYIGISHRNTLTTWSANPILIGPVPVTYDFTSSMSNAYGNNMVEVENGIWAFYTGDLVIDENIDLLDLTLLETDIQNFVFGYFGTDLNGDGNVDLLDAPIIEMNINNFIFASHP